MADSINTDRVTEPNSACNIYSFHCDASAHSYDLYALLDIWFINQRTFSKWSLAAPLLLLPFSINHGPYIALGSPPLHIDFYSPICDFETVVQKLRLIRCCFWQEQQDGMVWPPHMHQSRTISHHLFQSQLQWPGCIPFSRAGRILPLRALFWAEA